jgi:hypothetical protein
MPSTGMFVALHGEAQAATSLGERMPLRRSTGLPGINSDWVEFPMEDTLTNERVICRASYGALRKIGGNSASSRHELFGVFNRERAKIEARANAKFIDGQNPPHIFPEDL